MAQANAAAEQLVRSHLDQVSPPPVLDLKQREALRKRIRHLLQRENAVLVAHYYTDPAIQALAEETRSVISRIAPLTSRE